MTRLRGMDTAPPPGANARAARLDTEADGQRCLARQAEMIAEARASAAAGGVVSSHEVDAWIDSLGADHDQPARPTRRR